MRRVSLIVSSPSSLSSARPRARIPVPASSTIISPSARTSTQLVLPPYRIVAGPGTGSEPRTPPNFIRAGIAIASREDFPTCPREQLGDGPTTILIILNNDDAWHHHTALRRVFSATSLGILSGELTAQRTVEKIRTFAPPAFRNGATG